MRLAFFTMFRNEQSILGPFLDQVREFFDNGFFVDHESTDRSLDIIQSTLSAKFEVHRLKSSGYPQSELATYYARRIFRQTDADWLFFLDCDEFLPFANRRELTERLAAIGEADMVRMHWRNVVPSDLSGTTDIFSGPFDESGTLSEFYKVAVSRRLFQRDQQLEISQGYHHVSTTATASVVDLSEEGLIHIPVQSKMRFTLKIKSSAERLISEKHLLSKGLGSHWFDYYTSIGQQGPAKFDFRGAALAYPHGPAEQASKSRPVAFGFDYVKTPWRDEPDGLIADLYRSGDPRPPSPGFTLYTADEVLLTSQDGPEPALSRDAAATSGADPGAALSSLFGDGYSDLIEPLFSLPIKLPVTAWAGHIPFLFVLFRMLRPRSYVDLGVHNGASLIAAATAAKAYQVPTNFYGVDTWEGDPHAGFYDGDEIYLELKEFTARQFRNVHLVRRLFDDAVEMFAPGSIDLLHIDGLHTYEAVKHDFLTWLPKVSSSGVIMFHDTAVHERGFGVFRLFRELKDRFTTMEFFQSYGLGVLLLDPAHERIRPLASVLRRPDAMAFYQALVSDIASLLRGRMEHLEDQDLRANMNAEVARLRRTEVIETRRVGVLERDLAYARIAMTGLKLEAQHVGATKR